MPGLYIHIPFCKQACHYCDFHFVTSLRNKKQMLEAMHQEMRLQQHFFPLKEPLQSIYFGGGTPSMLHEAEIEEFLALADTLFGISAKAEITLEANPDDVSLGRLATWHQMGINRLSLGIQSFSDAVLQWANRAHSAQQALNAIEWIQKSDFQNFTIDLMYGFPHFTKTSFKAELQQFLAIQSPHISAYNLTIEKNTYFGKQKKLGKLKTLNESAELWQMEYTMETLQTHGYEQYEISNFAKSGFRAVHNAAYWHGSPYLGIGPSAHSYKPHQRFLNPPINKNYIDGLKSGRLVCLAEDLSQEDRTNEYLLTNLRLSEGISLAYLRELGYDLLQNHADTLDEYQKRGLIQISDGYLVLTQTGKVVADMIAQYFFIV